MLKADPKVSLWYTIRDRIKSVLFNNANLDVFRIKVREGLGKANAL